MGEVGSIKRCEIRLPLWNGEVFRKKIIFHEFDFETSGLEFEVLKSMKGLKYLPTMLFELCLFWFAWLCVGGKTVEWLLGRDSKEWVWVMGDHDSDKQIEDILVKERQLKANQLAHQEAEAKR